MATQTVTASRKHNFNNTAVDFGYIHLSIAAMLQKSEALLPFRALFFIPLICKNDYLLHSSTSGAPHNEMFSNAFQKVCTSRFLIDRPMAGHWRQASGGLFVGLAGAVAVGRRMSNTWAAGRRGRTGRGLGFDLQPLVSQGLCKVVIHRHADGQLPGAGFLVVHPQASLEMLFHHVLVVALGSYCWEERMDRINTAARPCESVKVADA